MSTGLLLHRAVVQSADPTTGRCSVRIPSLLGGQTVPIDSNGIPVSMGYKSLASEAGLGGLLTEDAAMLAVEAVAQTSLVPVVGTDVFVASTADLTQFSFVTSAADAALLAHDGATTADIGAHIAAVDPHPQYATDIDLNDHLVDTVAAHAASAISYVPSPVGAPIGITGTAVQSVIDQVIAMLVPAGTIWATCGSIADAGWVLLNGSTLGTGAGASSAQVLYPSLWGKVPASWKSGANIVLPNLGGRAIIGAGAGAGLTARTLGTAYSNEETHALTPAETAVKGHSHVLGSQLSTTENVFHTHTGTTSSPDINHTHGSTGGVSAGHTHDTPGDVIVNRDLAGRMSSTGASWWHGIASVTTYGQSGDHSHGTGWMDRSNTHNHTFGTDGSHTLHSHDINHTHTLNDGANGVGHNIMQPSFALNYQMKCH